MGAVAAIWVSGAIAAPSTVQAAIVVLVRAPRPSAIATEATVRLRGELVSAGFNVKVIDSPPGSDVRASLEEAAAAPGVEAVVAIIGAGWDDASVRRADDGAEVWVIDRVTGKTVVRRVPIEVAAGRAAAVLSIRALELLRASFLEVALTAAGRGSKTATSMPMTSSTTTTTATTATSTPAASASATASATTPSSSPSSSSPAAAPVSPTAPPPAEVTRWTDAALTEAMGNRWTATSTWAVEVGGCVSGSLEGFGPSLMPLVRVQHAFGDSLLGRVTLAGLGTRTQIDHQLTATDQAQAEVAQQFGLVEGAIRWRKDETWQPFVSGGAGVLHLSAAGQETRPPYQNLTRQRWSLLADVGAGVHVSFRRFELALEAHAQAAHPYPVIRFLNDEAAREGRPTLVSTFTFLVWM